MLANFIPMQIMITVAVFDLDFFNFFFNSYNFILKIDR